MKTYGTVCYNPKLKVWEIETEPHIAIRIKRVFGKMNLKQFKTLSITATPENCRDLEWFLSRYPMEVKPPELLASGSREHKERQALVESFLEGRREALPFALKLPPREYQSIGASVWLTNGGLLLADDVGLGKTATALCGFTDTRTLPALVVTLSHLPKQWKDEAEKFTDLNVHILTKGTPYDITARCRGRFPDIIVSNYHKLSGWAETLSPLIRSVVFDECQELRHTGSYKYAAAKHLADSVDFRLGMSATPIYNYGGEIFNVLDALRPGCLGSWEEFCREWCSGFAGKERINDPVAFGKYARESGAMLRRTRIEVKRELPAVTVVPHEIDADASVILKMKGEAIELAKMILRQGKQDFQGQKMLASAEFDMRMRQATGIAKAPFVAEFVRFLVQDNDESVVLFGWHREVYEIWKQHLAELKPVLYTGSESPTQKEESKRAFLSGDSRVIIISLRAGAGLDGLQNVANVCVFGEIDWSPGVHEQCIGRIHRDGQDKPVTAYYLLSEQGSDPIVSDVLGVKRQQIEGVRDPNRELVAKLQVESDYIRKLAAKFLADNGIEVPEQVSELATGIPEGVVSNGQVRPGV